MDDEGATPDRRLALVWSTQRRWSNTAGAAQSRLRNRRRWNLGLLVVGALAGGLAAQTWVVAGVVATVLAFVSAAALVLAGVLQQQLLSPDETARWIRARAASEALKAEVHRYLLRVAPYDGPDPGAVLDAQLTEVQRRSPHLLVDQQTAEADDTPLPAFRTVGDYATARAADQRDWHRGKSADHAGKAKRLRWWQLAATAVGGVLAAFAGFGAEASLSALTAAFTTIAAAIGALLAAAQHQRIAESYAVTADQLDRLVAGFDDAGATAERRAEFVAEVERVLAAQNDGWTDLLSTEPPANGDQAPA